MASIIRLISRCSGFNINVGMSKVYDNFDLGDSLEHQTLDPIPQFVSFHLDRTLLRPVESMDGHGTVLYRRALQPAVFSTTLGLISIILCFLLGRR